MRQILRVFSVLWCFASVTMAETVRLYVAEHLTNEQGGSTGTAIHEITFIDGNMAGVKEILRCQRSASIFEHQNQIIENRYAVAFDGYIVDLVAHAVTFEETKGLNFLGVDRNIAYYRSIENHVTGTKGGIVYSYSIMNVGGLQRVLFPGLYWRETDGSYGHGRIFSPNRKAYAFADFGGAICVYDSNGERPLCKQARATVSMVCNEIPVTPILWITDKLLLTQLGNGRPVSVDLNGRINEVATFECSQEPNPSPKLSRDPDGRIIYWCEKYYTIDMEKGTVTPYEWRPLGSGFYASTRASKTTRFKWSAGEIGELDCGYSTTATTEGYVATIYGEIGKYGAWGSKGVAIWNTSKREWTKVPFNWVAGVIGFIPTQAGKKK
jgi:hypothetical protein